MLLDAPPIDTATRRDPLPMTVAPDWMGYNEFTAYLRTLNLTPIAYEAAVKEYCDKQEL